MRVQRSLKRLNFSRFSRWRRTRAVQNATVLGLVFLGPVLAVLTYVVLGPLVQSSTSPLLRLILLADLVYVLVVAALVMAVLSGCVAVWVLSAVKGMEK